MYIIFAILLTLVFLSVLLLFIPLLMADIFGGDADYEIPDIVVTIQDERTSEESD